MAKIGKRVCIIYTGGTLGMLPTAKGYAPARDFGALLDERLPELRMATMPDYGLVEYDEPLDSSNASPRHWYELADRIRALRADYDGFIVIHGTDTLAYTASALSFLLDDLKVPIIVTGSQIPLCEVRSDAASNLISAAQAIASGQLDEVGVCFGRQIMRGNRTTKVHATELDAFHSPNCPPLAEIGTTIRFPNRAEPRPQGPFFTGEIPGYSDVQLAVLRIYPGISPRLIDAIVDAGTVGIVMRCYGVGTAPTVNPDFMAALKRATGSGVVLVAVSQCLEANVALRRYAAGSALADIGVVSGYDVMTEAAFAKMHALFSLGWTQKEITEGMQSNLCGELSVG